MGKRWGLGADCAGVGTRGGSDARTRKCWVRCRNAAEDRAVLGVRWARGRCSILWARLCTPVHACARLCTPECTPIAQSIRNRHTECGVSYGAAVFSLAFRATRKFPETMRQGAKTRRSAPYMHATRPMEYLTEHGARQARHLIPRI
jgi:hypothetical protein